MALVVVVVVVVVLVGVVMLLYSANGVSKHSIVSAGGVGDGAISVE